MWHVSLCPYVTIMPTESSHFQTVLLKPPDAVPSLHTIIYLPTAGKNEEFVTSLVELEAHINDLRSLHPNAPHFIRGDANCNPNNLSRFNLFSFFCSANSLTRLDLNHPTYHHFLGDGAFDSEIDVLLHHGNDISENLVEIICKLDSPFVNSHHDAILSSCSIPGAEIPTPDDNLVVAPRVPNNRTKVIWNEEGIEQYEKILGSALSDLRVRWGNSGSRSSLSLLLSSTYQLLSYAAVSTNKSIDLSSSFSKKPIICPAVKLAERKVLKCKKLLDKIVDNDPTKDLIENAKEELRAARASLRQATRSEQSSLRNKRDAALCDILSTNPYSVHHAIKASKNASDSGIQNLKVGDKVYSGENVPDGFYDSLSSLKAPDMSSVYTSPSFQDTFLDYENIIIIARCGSRIPHVSPVQAM